MHSLNERIRQLILVARRILSMPVVQSNTHNRMRHFDLSLIRENPRTNNVQLPRAAHENLRFSTTGWTRTRKKWYATTIAMFSANTDPDADAVWHATDAAKRTWPNKANAVQPNDSRDTNRCLESDSLSLGRVID
jgi:hypothetical protein